MNKFIISISDLLNQSDLCFIRSLIWIMRSNQILKLLSKNFCIIRDFSAFRLVFVSIRDSRVIQGVQTEVVHDTTVITMLVVHYSILIPLYMQLA